MSLIFFTGTKKRKRQQSEEIDSDLLETGENISHKKRRHHYDHISSDSDSYDTHSSKHRKKQTRKSHKKKSKHGRRHHSKHKGIVILI